MDWWLWVLAGLALIGLEAFAPGPFYFLFLGIAAVAVGAVEAGASIAGSGLPVWLQLLLFSALAGVGLAWFRRLLVAAVRARAAVVPEVDAIAGQEALLLGDLAGGETGQAELRGTVWSVRNDGAGSLPKGARCRIERVDGLTLVVRGT
jgi:membrane protein implicated in regulation of membrane protease activity